MKRWTVLIIAMFFLWGCESKKGAFPQESLDEAINAMTELEGLGLE